MTLERSKEWWVRRAQMEGDYTIGAGCVALDPKPDESSAALIPGEGVKFAFGRLVSLMRRERGLSIEKLADEAAIELAELVSIEEGIGITPEPRTIYQLARTFKLPQQKLMQLAGLAVARDDHLEQEAVRFAARSESTERLSRHERAALEAFVSVLTTQPAQKRK